ncbi:hypothetical protein [Lysobacter gummosus]
MDKCGPEVERITNPRGGAPEPGRRRGRAHCAGSFISRSSCGAG